MRSLQDSLYNWLSIKVVADARPEDTAAGDTFRLFDELLKENHDLNNVQVHKDEVMYLVSYTLNGESKSSRFPVELIDSMIDQIEAEPEKYVNYK
ncbi:hypothetical protein LIT32_10095 [Bacillus sp. CMF21]|uniref:hypothetical protein n=1 Tax=Metabacillus dongyingensis TaxID=2874282 RepID=UPI001CC08528|nr:hypothetical protein [Metabacillus dongyingensis]UAL54108.1 hypothetical protein K8L98_10195 [Metabacillus dongyingensis]UOK59442.1 hypothetical protein MGI18_11820 [Bacillus sp. OVS6]USK30426.1 hypothetical protein LIT32_10095 [Bacillus sp. CMF21]